MNICYCCCCLYKVNKLVEIKNAPRGLLTNVNKGLLTNVNKNLGKKL